MQNKSPARRTLAGPPAPRRPFIRAPENAGRVPLIGNPPEQTRPPGAPVAARGATSTRGTSGAGGVTPEAEPARHVNEPGAAVRGVAQNSVASDANGDSLREGRARSARRATAAASEAIPSPQPTQYRGEIPAPHLPLFGSTGAATESTAGFSGFVFDGAGASDEPPASTWLPDNRPGDRQRLSAAPSASVASERQRAGARNAAPASNFPIRSADTSPKQVERKSGIPAGIRAIPRLMIGAFFVFFLFNMIQVCGV